MTAPQTWMTNMKKFKEHAQIDEAPLVMSDMDMVDTLWKEVRDKILSSSFLAAKSITRNEAFDLKDECVKFVDEVELRGWD